MSRDIPPEAQAAIDAFNAEEAARAAERAGGGERKAKKERRMLERLQSGKVFTPDELAGYALGSGWTEIQGGGHRKFQNENGRIFTIPRSGGQQKTIEPDTAHRILEQIFPDLF